MKTNKMICLDVEIVERLRGFNISALINTLLKEYLEMQKLKELPLEELYKIREKNLKIKELNEQITILENE